MPPCLRTGEQTVVTVDMLTEGVDFLLAEADPRRIGRKALAVNLSDLAAMAARPVAAVVALGAAAAGRPRTSQDDLRRAAAAGRRTTSWPSPAATPTAGTGRS